MIPISSYGCVPAFGHLRIYAHLQLPVAFRSLSRPSSALDAKASSVRSFFAQSFESLRLVFLPEIKKLSFQSLFSFFLARHLLSILPFIKFRTKSLTYFNAYYSFSLLLLSFQYLFSLYIMQLSMCKLSATVGRLSRPERDSLISIPLFNAQVKHFYKIF